MNWQRSLPHVSEKFQNALRFWCHLNEEEKRERDITMLGWLTTTFNIIKMSSIYLPFIQGKNYFSWRVSAASCPPSPAFWARILEMSHENNALPAQQRQSNRRETSVNVRNSFILKATMSARLKTKPWSCHPWLKRRTWRRKAETWLFQEVTAISAPKVGLQRWPQKTWKNRRS